MSAHQTAYRLLKKEGSASKAIYRGVKGAAKGFLESGELVAQRMAEQGVKSPVALAAAKAAPYATAIYGGKKAYESDPVQNLKFKIQNWQAERAMRNAQQGGYY